MNLSNHSEQQNALSAHGAAVGTTMPHMEQARAAGVYTIKCTGPIESRTAEYSDLRDKLFAHEADGTASTPIAIELAERFAAIPIEEKWTDSVINLVTTVGGNNMLDNHLAGSGYTATWFIGLMSNVSYGAGAALGDTAASHAGWTESVAYSNATRPTTAWNAAASKSKSLSAGLVFNINATDTIKGCFLISNNTKGGTTGTLYSAGLFTGGDQPVVNTNTLTVSYTATV